MTEQGQTEQGQTTTVEESMITHSEAVKASQSRARAAAKPEAKPTVAKGDDGRVTITLKGDKVARCHWFMKATAQCQNPAHRPVKEGTTCSTHLASYLRGKRPHHWAKTDKPVNQALWGIPATVEEPKSA